MKYNLNFNSYLYNIYNLLFLTRDFSITEGNGYKMNYDVKSYSGNAGLLYY